MAQWATVANVLSVTGKTVTEDTLSMAEESVSIYVNRVPADLPTEAISARDLHWLNRAVCWQAAWIPGQPGYADQLQIAKSIDQDGAKVERMDESSHVLAPLARRAIMNLSWKGTRTRLIPGYGAVAGGVPDPLAEADDARMPWVRL